MEDDDEFGDLYTDVLRPFTSSSVAQPSPTQSAAPSASRPIDLNIQSDDEEIFHGAPNSKLSFNFSSSNQNQNQNQTLVFDPKKAAPELIISEKSDSRTILDSGVKKEDDVVVIENNWASDSTEPIDSRVLESGGDVKLEKRTFEDPIFMEKSGIDVVVDERDDKHDKLVGENETLIGKSENFQNFDIEEADTGIGDLVSEPIIPGLSIAGAADAANDQADANFVTRDEASGDDWDSDSEDDLQIVLNDNNHGPMTMDMGAEDDDEDEDGDPLVIVADGDQSHQPMDDQEWGEDGAQGADGERKEPGDAAKMNGGGMVPPKMGYINHGYHPFNSQFKYVRPGAAPIPGATPAGPGGVPSQVRAPVSAGPIAGRGRGDWRPMQKSFHPGFGMAAWGNNAPGRAFGSGLEFTLPSYKTIFDVEIDSFEEKPWKLPGMDISNFFNFGLNEESWKDYRKQLEQLRMEATMQSKIRVYESGRTEQEYDPDLPPELAAAAGIHVVLSENASVGKTDAGQSDLAKVSAQMRPPLPIGRPIQVETGYGERLPSIDTRPPRIRDSDAIIEIVLQDSTDDDSFPGNDVSEKPENDPSREDLKESHEIEEDIITQEDTEHFDDFPNAYNGRKTELIGRRAPFAPSVSGSINEQERWTKGKTREKSPDMTPSEGAQDKRFLDNQKEDSVESNGGTTDEQGLEHFDGTHDELVKADGTSETETEERGLDKMTDTLKDGNLVHSMKRQKLSSQVEQPSVQEIDNGDDSKGSRSSENSRDYQKVQDEVDEEVVEGERSLHIKRPLDEDEQSVHRKRSDERPQVEMHRIPTRRDRGPNSAHYSHLKTVGVERRKERDNSDGARQWRDDDPHGKRTRSEDTRKWDHGDEIGSRNRLKVRESERSDKDEHLQLRKQLDNGSWRGHRDNDMGSSHNLKNRSDVDDLRSKRRKEEEHSRRERPDKEVILHGPMDTTTRRRRERDDVLDQRKRDEQARTRDDDHHYVKHKEEEWFQRERSERHRLKQLHEESLSKLEREDGRGGVRSGRAGEDKLRVSHTRVKDEFKGLSQHRGREDVYARGNQLSNDERRSRQERPSTHNDRAINAPDNHRANEKKHKDNTRKRKEYEDGDNNALSKKNQEDLRGQINEPVILKGTSGRGGSNEGKISVNHHSSKKHKEDASSDDEHQDSRRGRSKLERWTSHKERDFSIGAKSSSSLKIKEIERYNNGGSSLLASKFPDESSKTRESVDHQRLLGDEKEKDGGDAETKYTDVKAAEDKHLDTVEKLKKRRERFKLPMPSEKEPTVIKKMETEPLPSAPSETHADSEIKPERPARKRRWISN